MARAYSQDLRDRVIDAALAGLPARQAAVRFGVGIATAIGWVSRARRSGERAARRQGQPRRSKLDPHRDFLLGLIERMLPILHWQRRGARGTPLVGLPAAICLACILLRNMMLGIVQRAHAFN